MSTVLRESPCNHRHHVHAPAHPKHLLHVSSGCKGVFSMSDDVANNRSGTKTDTRTRTGTIFRCLTRINLGHRICFRGNVEAHVRVGVCCCQKLVATAVFVMVVRWCSSVHKISESDHQSFSPTAVGERSLNLAKSLLSNVMRWHDAAIAMIDWLRLSSK